MDSQSDLRLARELPLRPSTAPHVSASLEGSEPTLEQGESSPSRSRPPLDVKDKQPFCSPARRTEALNANHSFTAPSTDGVRPPFPTVAVTGVPSANSGHCSAIPGAVAALWVLRRGTQRARHCSRTILPTPAVRTLPHHTHGPRPTSSLGRGTATPRAPPRGTHSTRSRDPGPPPSKGPGPPRVSRTS